MYTNDDYYEFVYLLYKFIKAIIFFFINIFYFVIGRFNVKQTDDFNIQYQKLLNTELL